MMAVHQSPSLIMSAIRSDSKITRRRADIEPWLGHGAPARQPIKILTGILCLSLFLVGWAPLPQQTTTVRACVYENAPKIYTDDNGVVTGFWPELLGYIAAQEGWDIEWVHGVWEDCLMMLADNEIDILPDTGWTEERAQAYDFSSETVLISWTRVYVPKGSTITSLVDLEGKKVGALADSFNLDGPEGLKDLTMKFGINATFIEMSSYVEVFEALESGELDAGITNKDFGNLNESKYDVERTPIIFQPARLQFAFTKNAPLTPTLMERIDNWMRELKADTNSIYYQSLELYLEEREAGSVEMVIPAWVKNLAAIGGVVILFLVATNLTARAQVKRRTAELKKHQSLLQTITESTTDAIFVKDVKGKYVLYNGGAERSIGKPPIDILGRDDWAVFPNHAEAIIEADRAVIAGGKTITYEETLPDTDGQYRTFLTTKGPLFDNNKTFLGVFGIARDITQRKQAEDKLRESEKKFRTLTESSPVGIFLNDAQGNAIYINNRCAELVGVPAEQALNLDWVPLIHPADRERVTSQWIRAVRNAAPFSEDYRWVHADGNVVWTHGEISPVHDEQGNISMFIGVLIDISERKRAEAERALLDRVQTAVATELDLPTVLRTSVESIAENFGYDYVSLYLLRDKTLVLQHQVGYSQVIEQIPITQGVAGRVARSGQPELIRDVRADSEFLPAIDGLVSEICVPISNNGRVVGILNMERSREIVLAESDLRLMTALSQSLNLAIARAELYTNLRDSERALLHAQAIAHIGNWELRLDEGEMRWSDELYKIYGLDRLLSELTPDELLAMIEPEDRERYQAYLFKMMKQQPGEPPMTLEYRINRSSGDKRHLYAWAEVEFDEHGNKVRHFGIVQDITERKRAEQALKDSRDRLADLSRQLVEAHETEQRAIGRELHDQIGQMLTTLKLTIEISSQLPPDQAAKKLADAQEIVDDLMNRISRLSLELRPPMLDDLGLLPTLLWHINHYQEQMSVEVVFKHSALEGRRFYHEIETTVYRLVQESLTNVARHAQATRVRLEVRVRSRQIEIQIEDNGQGFDPQVAFAKNRGLGGMRERVNLLGGTFQIESQAGRGAIISIQLPLREEAE